MISEILDCPAIIDSFIWDATAEEVIIVISNIKTEYILHEKEHEECQQP